MLFEFGSYRFDLLSLFLASTALTGVFISLYLFKYRKSPGLSYLALLQLSTSVWAFFYFLEYSANELSARLFWSKLSYLGITAIPVWFYLFAVCYTSRQRKSSLWLKALLFLSQTIFFGLALTNDFHHLNWRETAFDPVNHTTIYKYGPVFWLIVTYVYGLLLLGVIRVIRLIRRYSQQIHQSIWLIVLAVLVPSLGNLIYIFKINPFPGFDWTPLCFFVSGLILAYFGIHYGAIDLIPFARRKLIDFMDDGFLLCDVNFRVADINHSLLQLMGLQREQILGSLLNELFPGYSGLIEKIKQNKLTTHSEITIGTGEQFRILDLRSTPLLDKHQIPCGYLLTFREITLLKKQELTILETNINLKKEIEEKEELIIDLDNFAQTVAHDLRNTIGSIYSLAELIEEELNNKQHETAMQFNDLVRVSARKTLYIMDELLTMSRIRHEDIQKEEVDMRSVVTEARSRLDDLILQRQAVIEEPANWPDLQAVPSWIEEVWVNYLSNAIKYGGKHPHIQLGYSAAPQPGYLQFWVQDNGNGISTEEQALLFIKHNRLDATRAQGTGLGLFIVKRIIEKLGGEVGVSSRGIPGQGSRFFFILPEK